MFLSFKVLRQFLFLLQVSTVFSLVTALFSCCSFTGINSLSSTDNGVFVAYMGIVFIASIGLS